MPIAGTRRAGLRARDGDMEASINGIGPSGVPARRPEVADKGDAPARVPHDDSAPAWPAPTIELAAWFDRNGDGQIDTTSSVNGGDAYLHVGKMVSEVLDRSTVRPRDRLALANEAAVNAYRKYGAVTPTVHRPRNS
jgi:hypothetical protein